jgi:hypothetical protein
LLRVGALGRSISSKSEGCIYSAVPAIMDDGKKAARDAGIY